jgi:hypothetical protein
MNWGDGGVGIMNDELSIMNWGDEEQAVGSIFSEE